jgi:phage terminase large subunit-like protein
VDTSRDLSLKQRLEEMTAQEREAFLDRQPGWILAEMSKGEWWYVSRPSQVPPEGPQIVNLFLAGRGAGKTRSGAEWIISRTERFPVDRHGIPTERIIIAETLSDASKVCVEGPAGVLNVLARKGYDPKKDFKYIKSPRPMIRFANGCKIYCDGADNPDVGRGYTSADVWMDEICKWKYSYESWYEGIMPGLRADLLTDHPRAFVTTTPKPIKILQEWVARADQSVHIIRGSTFDNAANLNAHVLKELENRYAGTALGRQELYGELLEAMDGALFKRSDIAAARVDTEPDDLISIVVGVDPALTDDGDEMGVVVVGRTRDNHMYVLADRSLHMAGRDACIHIWRTFAEFGADVVVYEANLGRRYMSDLLTDTYRELVRNGELPEGTTPSMRGLDVRIGKRTRAEPVALRCEQKRLHMVGTYPELEDQLCLFNSWDGKESPDRLDAMVHACRHLMDAEKQVATVTSPWDIAQRLDRDHLGTGGYDYRRW